jgi:PadR family transcriptional regulator PadR
VPKDSSKLSYNAALVLRAIGAGYSYGFDIMQATRLPSGTVYPALRRLEQQELIKSDWEEEPVAFAEQRPARKYYRLTRAGEDALQGALQRYGLLARLPEVESSQRR